MSYDIKAKPTTYRGINFRSILEAKWAAFFDLVGWKYQYEPFEIGGRLPDFILYCERNVYQFKQVIVEIKPEAFCTEDFYKSLHNAYKDYPAIILVLNENPFSTFNDYVIKLGVEVCFDEFHPDKLYIDEIAMKRFDDFSSYYMSWDSIMFGTVERKNFLTTDDHSMINEMEIKRLMDIWKQAGNAVQFKSY